jgi:hypothetical protein
MSNSIYPLIAGLVVSVAALSPGCRREAPKESKDVTVENGKPQVLSWHYNSVAKVLTLQANKYVLQGPVDFHLRAMWRYDVGDKKWVNLHIEPTSVTITKNESADKYVAKLSLDIGLYWLAWTENDVGYSSLVPCGMLCNDLMIGPPPSGYVVACIPDAKGGALAAFVPDPKIHCRDTATTASTSTTGKAG